MIETGDGAIIFKMPSKAFVALVLCASIAGSGLCQESPQCDIVGECVGDLLGFAYEEAAEDCLAECKNAQGCLWYSYNADVSLVRELLCSKISLNP